MTGAMGLEEGRAGTMTKKRFSSVLMKTGDTSHSRASPICTTSRAESPYMIFLLIDLYTAWSKVEINSVLWIAIATNTWSRFP